MCDDVSRIMALVEKVKEIEKVTGRELGKWEYGLILQAMNNQKSFCIDFAEFSPPSVTRGLRDHQEEMGLRVHEVDPW